jgi:hypothetical protein
MNYKQKRKREKRKKQNEKKKKKKKNGYVCKTDRHYIIIEHILETNSKRISKRVRMNEEEDLHVKNYEKEFHGGGSEEEELSFRFREKERVF